MHAMRRLMEAVQPAWDAGEMKFWYHPKTNRFVMHDFDEHHVRLVAKNYKDFGIDKEEIIHNPWVEGSPNHFSDPHDRDENDEDDGWSEDDADNDTRVRDAAFKKGWVRGGHIIDPMQYHEMNRIDHEGGIYLQGMSASLLRRAAKSVMQRWPQIEFLRVEVLDRINVDLFGPDILAFIEKGTIPREVG